MRKDQNEELKNELINKIREPSGDDTGLFELSYSRMDTFLNCPLSFKIKYLEGKRTDVKTLPLELGSLLHYALELKAILRMNDASVNYEVIKTILYDGTDELAGINDLSRRYFETWYSPDDASGMNYKEKTDLFISKVLPTRIEDPDWKVCGAELPFRFVYDNRIILDGFIDRLDVIETEEGKTYRITDYKTSKKVFPDAKLKTPMQHIFYDLAVLYKTGEIPEEHVYDFIVLDKQLNSKNGVCSNGYFQRGIKKLDKTLDSIDDLKKTGEYPPKPSPLCYWCPYHSKSPNADEKYKGLCQYHSLWTPTDKNYDVLNKYNPEDHKPKILKTDRKLIF